MLTFSQMLIRFLIALLLGAVIGLEREMSGREAGVRTSMLVSSGAAIFAIIALTLPYIVAISPDNLAEVIARNSGFLGIIANIVVGVGFLGAGIIFKVKDGEHVRGLTTAATVWITAAVGTLVGIGLINFAAIIAVFSALSLYFLKKVKLFEKIRPTDAN